MSRFGAAILGSLLVLAFASSVWGPKPEAAESDLSPFEKEPKERCLLQPIEIDSLACAAAILVEARTGAVLYEQNADVVRAPASLVKMMLETLILEDVARGDLSLDDSVFVSKHAVDVGGARIGLVAGERVPLGTLLESIAVVSANDCAIAAAEHAAGSEEKFVERMNARAAALGCEHTKFSNCHGLDFPGYPGSESTARDLSKIARVLIEQPDALRIASLRETMRRKDALLSKTTNELLETMEGVDGLKTGFTTKAGGCFCGTIERGGVRFVSVVLGAAPGSQRFDMTRTLFERAYVCSPHWVDSRLLASSPETR
ncbi:MAG TPA: D-alanyl-D-alanine carboxypeptidase family protein [bacterium]|nr:D-alanyl-D-alanine carboxypeptidase family protein [bacterium]